MVRLDMSEYQERHTVSRLVGAPPGYVGYEEGGQLTEAVRRKPYSVVLFDEIEKAHADVFNTLLQVLDDGRITDAQGRTVDFRNTVIIMTSNIGSEYLLDGVTGDGEHQAGRPGAGAWASCARHFRPEFLNRVDDIVLFKPLALPQIERIVDLQFDELRRRLAERRITLELTEAARRLIAARGLRPGLRGPAAAPLHLPRGRDPHRPGPAARRRPRRGHDPRRRRATGSCVVTYDQPGGRTGAGRHEHDAGRRSSPAPTAGAQPGARGRGEGRPAAANCQQPLPWLADAGDDDFAEVVERADRARAARPVGAWCGPCRMVAPRWSRSPPSWPAASSWSRSTSTRPRGCRRALRASRRYRPCSSSTRARRSPGRRAPHPPPSCAGGWSSRSAGPGRVIRMTLHADPHLALVRPVQPLTPEGCRGVSAARLPVGPPEALPDLRARRLL